MSEEDVILSLRKAALVTGLVAALVSGIGATFATAAFYKFQIGLSEKRLDALEIAQRLDRELLYRIDENVKQVKQSQRDHADDHRNNNYK